MSQQINLFNPIFLKTKKIFTANAMARALAVLGLGLGGFVIYLQQSVAGLEAERRSVQAQLALRQEQHKVAVETYKPRQKTPALEAEVRQAEAQLKSMQLIATVLNKGEVGNTDGFGTYFKALARQNVQGLWLTGVDIEDAGQHMSLRGRAMQADLVPAYIARLQQESALKGKSFASLKINLPGEAAPPPAALAPKSGMGGFGALFGGGLPSLPAIAPTPAPSTAGPEVKPEPPPYIEFALYARPEETAK